MASEFLRTDTFEIWAANFERRLDEALQVRGKVDKTAEDVAVLKDRSERAHRFALSSLVASCLSFCANLILKAFGH